jgi:hypothetical protein
MTSGACFQQRGWAVKAVALISAMAAGIWLGVASVGAYDHHSDW